MVYLYHKLIIFQMAENSKALCLQSQYIWQIPCISYTQLPNFSTNPTFQFQNLGFYQYYHAWNPANRFPEIDINCLNKNDESNIIQQTSTGSRLLEIQEKQKKIQSPRFRPTKNNESNICNQAFSFMTNAKKSKSALESMFKNKNKAQIFYHYAKCLSSKRKKYMSKGTLLKLCKLTHSNEEIEQIIKLKKQKILTIKEFQSGICFLILYFLKYKSTSSILTSQKIAPNLKKDHFHKVREILKFVQQNMDIEQQSFDNSSQGLKIKIES